MPLTAVARVAGHLGGLLTRANFPGWTIRRDCKRSLAGCRYPISMFIGEMYGRNRMRVNRDRRGFRPPLDEITQVKQTTSSSGQGSSRAYPNCNVELISKSIHHDAAAIRNANQVFK